ncbi:sulfatase [Paenibacillus sp. 1P07SE]|uniref:sulfatase family protein n=1 Tax=Paenibacillus sp. 1P07SE TaxID=3132209 RepID=UPI0039A411B9
MIISNPTKSADREQPHVIIIMADQLRWDVIGEHTPHINSLRSESVDFQRSYCASPICVPARGAFFSGRYPGETGCLINPWEKSEAAHGEVRSGIPHLYSLLEQQWDSWHTGKQHFYHADQPDNQPDALTHWRPFHKLYNEHMKQLGRPKPGGPEFKAIAPELMGGTVTKAKRYSIPTTGCYEEGLAHFYDSFITRSSLEALRSRDPDKPMLLNAMFLAPHPPLHIPEPYYSRFREVQMPENVGRWSPNQSPLQLYNVTGALGSHYTRADWARIWPVYLGLVSLLDDCVGQLIDELKRQQMYDNSLIVFTSDHGEMLGSHKLWQKMCMYEESSRIPLYIKFPADAGIAPRQVHQLVSAIDVLPTLCDALGVVPPDGLPGHSLMPSLQGAQHPREQVFIQYDGNGSRGNYQRCIVADRHKLIVDHFKDEIYLELYDTEADPQEHCNLAFECSQEALIRSLLSKLEEHMRSISDHLVWPEDLYSDFIHNYGPHAVPQAALGREG